MSLNSFQIQITTGRLTLPVVILVCLLLWGITSQHWSDLGSLGIVALTGYLMIELNTAFTLIRTRTTFHVAIFWFLMSILIFLHPFKWVHLVPVFFILSIFQLFASYESISAQSHIFHSFFFLSLGSLLFPPFLYYVPLFFFSTVSFRSFSFKSVLGGLLGLTVPYWFLFGHAFWHEQMSLFYQPLKELIYFQPITYSIIPSNEWVSWLVTTFLLIGCIFHYFQVSYQDKTRTRIFLSFTAITSLWTTVFVFLQPQHLSILWPIQLIGTALLATHSFTLTRNRTIGICFVVTFVTLLILTCYNLWTQFFNF